MQVFPTVKNPIYGLKSTPIFKTIVHSYGNGIEQRLAVNAKNKCTYDLSWEYLSDNDKTLILNHFISCNGSLESFAWLNPVNKKTYEVRFSDSLLNLEYFNYKLHNLTVSFIAFKEIIISSTTGFFGLMSPDNQNWELDLIISGSDIIEIWNPVNVIENFPTGVGITTPSGEKVLFSMRNDGTLDWGTVLYGSYPSYINFSTVSSGDWQLTVANDGMRTWTKLN